ncbi:MAG: NAD(P)H-hydrate dehydratase [bacterium]
MALAVVTADEMRELDRITIEELGIPGVVLMEVAGRGVAEVVQELAPTLVGWRVAIVCGAGNNGGDGYVVARHLALRGAEVQLLLLAPRDRIRGDALRNLEVAEKLQLPMEWLEDDGAVEGLATRLAEFDCVVDALLGTGLSSDVRGRYRLVVEAINAARVLTVAVDIPSGLSADTAQPLGVAVEADVTVTFAQPKVGLVSHPGVEYAGDVHVVDIGIPGDLVSRLGVRCHLLEERDVSAVVPTRRLGGHKGTYGHVLAVAGSPGKTGAAVLCARAAARVGAGLVTVAVPEDAQQAVAAQSLETMTEVYTADSGSIDPDACLERLAALCRGKQALVVGPGIPNQPEMLEVLRELLSDAVIPVVLDADGLNLVARAPALLDQVTAPLVLTPHPGEMARLLGREIAEVQADRVKTAREAAARFGAYVVLKGARTVIAAPDGTAFINPTGNPGLGSGGVGDVLTGMLGGFLAQAIDPLEAVQLAVYLHGVAGDRAAQRLGQHAVLAGDLLDEVPVVLKRWEDRLDALSG